MQEKEKDERKEKDRGRNGRDCQNDFFRKSVADSAVNWRKSEKNERRTEKSRTKSVTVSLHG